MADEPTPKLSIWRQFLKVVKNPISVLSDKTKDSPLITIMAIVFILQPIITTGIELVKGMVEVRDQLKPGNRPITKNELEIVNSKIDFLQQLIVTDMQRDAAAEEERHGSRHRRDDGTSTPPATVAAVPPPATSPPSVKAEVDDARSRFRDLNKRLETIQAPLDKQFIENSKK